MVNLTFGEQVKIVLSRKGLTIKELAETIEERTGKKMSRQNMTQRLGRDNFQEQDMRMIADILGCSFQLSIMGEAKPAVHPTKVEEILPTEKELLKLEREKEKKERKPAPLKPVIEVEEEKEATEGRDITIGELVDINEELDALLEEGFKDETPAKMSVEEIMEEVEAIEKESRIKESEEKAAEFKGAESDKKSRGWKTYLKRMTTRIEESLPEETQAEQETDLETVIADIQEADEEDDYVDFENREEKTFVEEEMDMIEEDEDFDLGDINPYTGHEFQTNSVRVHPKRIGYVQVYDRTDHRWTDMTEWAFLGYQERKKALLGKDYEPPIYLD